MTERVEHIGDAVLYLGDCLEILPILGNVDAVVTDPPYGIKDQPMLDLPGRGGRGNNDYHPKTTWDGEINPGWCLACCQASKIVAWFGQWRKRPEVESAMLWPIRTEIIWAKDTHVGPPCPVAMRDERIWVFSASGIKGATFETSVWDQPIIPTWGFKHHKNEKPAALMSRLIQWLGSKTILDPFMGSGTTGVACAKLGRKFIGVEIDEKYFNIACERIQKAYDQPDMFIEPPRRTTQESLI